MIYDRIARVTVGKTNRDPCDLVDVARRQVDHLGPAGIAAKRGQTNEVFLRRGHLDFVFATRSMRGRFVERIEEHCHPAVSVSLLRRPRR
jgi:hypothetical protein